ncbi:MAG: RluA family pseudouridine synthase [Lachnospiraceae bacterium]|nr:RluA family pseudouridine synthase [Lachnospiraceae bacterium]
MNNDRILYNDKNIIVCHKPAGIATQTARVGQADMESEITNYLKADRPDSKKPVYVRVIHRLDQPVEGILVFAKSKAAAADLSRQAAGDVMKKEYLAVVCGENFPQRGELKNYLLKDGKTNTSRVVPSEIKGAKEARLSYEVLSEGPLQTALVRIQIHTGRHHQIRVQMANAGMPLLGDRKYTGEAAAFVSSQLGIREIALCAYRLTFIHPITGEEMTFEVEPEGEAFHKVKNK